MGQSSADNKITRGKKRKVKDILNDDLNVLLTVTLLALADIPDSVEDKLPSMEQNPQPQSRSALTDNSSTL